MANDYFPSFVHVRAPFKAAPTASSSVQTSLPGERTPARRPGCRPHFKTADCSTCASFKNKLYCIYIINTGGNTRSAGWDWNKPTEMKSEQTTCKKSLPAAGATRRVAQTSVSRIISIQTVATLLLSPLNFQIVCLHNETFHLKGCSTTVCCK